MLVLQVQMRISGLNVHIRCAAFCRMFPVLLVDSPSFTHCCLRNHMLGSECSVAVVETHHREVLCLVRRMIGYMLHGSHSNLHALHPLICLYLSFFILHFLAQLLRTVPHWHIRQELHRSVCLSKRRQLLHFHWPVHMPGRLAGGELFRSVCRGHIRPVMCLAVQVSEWS